MTFEFLRYRFHFRSVDALYFPPYKSGNIVRGAFGSIFRKLVCVPDCRDARRCEVRATCPYARVFEPRAARGQGPSGFADWPRPFVFRASHLDGRTVGKEEAFHFDAHLFDLRDSALPYFVRTFAQLASEGLGPGRGRAALTGVEQLDLAGAPVLEGTAPVSVELSDAPEPVDRLRMRFVTPTELKSDHDLVDRPEFAILFARLRDRVSTLRAIYGAGPLEIDFRALGQLAAGVRLTHCELQRVEAERTSSRSGCRHSLGGFVGEVEYRGDLGKFLAYIRLGRWVGVGRQTVWGKGEIETVEV